jgi:hypothetical protein
VACAPAVAQTESAPQESSTSDKPAIGLNGSLLPSAHTTKDSPPDMPAATGNNTDAAPPDSAKAPAAAPDSDAAKDSNAPKFDLGRDSTSSAAPSVAVPSADKKKALSLLRRSTRDYEPCKRSCLAYFDSFGVAFNFADGTIAAYAHEQRGKISGHDCVVNARGALARGDRSLAAQWMMAAQTDILNRNWIADHPDAMLEALRTFRGWA